MKKDISKGGLNYGLIIKSALLNIIFTGVFVFIFSIIMYLTQTGYEYSTVFATVSLGVGGFVSAFYAAKKLARKGFLIGALVGGVSFVAILLISLFVDKGGITFNTLFHFIIIMLSSLIGGIIGVNKSAKKYI